MKIYIYIYSILFLGPQLNQKPQNTCCFKGSLEFGKSGLAIIHTGSPGFRRFCWSFLPSIIASAVTSSYLSTSHDLDSWQICHDALVVGGTVVEIDARLAPVLASTNPILEELRNEISVSDGQVGVNPKRNPKRTLEWISGRHQI